jgi:hypothetical protein
MEAADPLVIELDRVALFPADRHGGFEFLEHLSAVGAVQHS